MAVIFGLWAETKDEKSLRKLQEHFHNLKHTFLTGKTIQFQANIENNGVRGLCVWSSRITRGYGIENLKDALEATEAGIFLYSRLLSAPDFRFAEIGWNAENYTSIDLAEDVHTGSDGNKYWSGRECVVNDELFKELGSPRSFRNFRQGYWWQKYRGETYDPLFSDDQQELRRLCENILPDNFD